MPPRCIAAVGLHDRRRQDIDDQPIGADAVEGLDPLVVEILSPGTRKRDEGIKRRLFERSGVREYWLVDPALNTVQIYRRAADDSFPRVATLTAENGDTLDSPLLPGFILALEKLFAARR